MTYGISSIFIDIAVIISIIYGIWRGYEKGFLTKIFDILTLVLVIAVTMMNYSSLAARFTIYQASDDLVDAFLAPIINAILLMLALFVTLLFVRRILQILFEPLCEMFYTHFDISFKADVIVAGILSALEYWMLCYVALSFVFTPLFINSREAIQESTVGRLVYEYHLPTPSESFNNNIYNFLIVRKDAQSNEKDLTQDLLTCVVDAYMSGLVSDVKAASLVEEWLDEDIRSSHPTLSADEYSAFEDILSASELSENHRAKLLAAIINEGNYD